MFDPIGGKRGDWQAASIVAILMTIAARGKKSFSPKDFILEYGDAKEFKIPRKSWQEMKMTAQMIAAAFTEPNDRPEQKKRKRS